MSQKLVVLFILVWGCLKGSAVFAQDEDFFFEHLEVEQGLSQQTVTAIFQDAQQYMWFGTRNGLNRYDGYKFKKYRKDYDDPNSLADSYVQAIVQDKEQNIWVATSRGINRINGQTDQMKRYSIREYVNTLLFDSEGRLIVGTSKYSYYYDQQLDTFRILEFQGENVPQNVLAILEDHRGNYYFGTQKQGVLVYDHQMNYVRQIHWKNEEVKLPVGYVSFLMEEREDRIWIGISERVLCCYNPIRNELQLMEKVSNVRKLLDWNKEYLLVATFHGLVWLNKQSLEVTPIDIPIGTQGGLSHYSITTLFRDKSENLWVGTYAGGLNYYNKYNYRFKSVIPEEFSGIIGMGTEDAQGTIWLASEGGGLLSYDPRRNHLVNYWVHERKSGVYNRNIVKSLLLEDDVIYCAMHGAEIYRFSIPEKRFRLMYGFGHGDICTLFRDSEGRLWVPTNTKYGLVVMKGNQQVEELNLKKKYPELGVIVSILEIRKKVFLLGTRTYGLFIYDEKADYLSRISGKDMGLDNARYLEVTSMIQDHSGDIWVATNGAGLFAFDNQMKLKQRFAKAEGLMDECVHGVVEHQNEIWLMGAREFYRLDREEGRLKRFYSIDEVIPSEFTPSGIFSGKDGRLYLSGSKGFLIVDPEKLRENIVEPQVLLTGLKIDNEECLPGAPGSPLEKKLGMQSKIELNHNQTNLTIGYTALNYLYPQQNQYAYRMKGLEEKWNYVGNRREAYYSNLKPGKYVFQVMASNNDGIWNREGAEVEIVVWPPWWWSWWACLIYVLIAFFAFTWIVRSRHRKHELERSLHLKQLEQEKLQELADERTHFFTCVTHEFRTPLTLIINPLNDLLQKYVHVAGVKDSLVLVRRNAERLMSLVNSLMDFEKQQAGKVEFDPVCFDFVSFVRDIATSFASIADSRKIHFKYKIIPEYLPIRYDKEKLEQVFFNILSNAFKFTQENGHVNWQISLISFEEAVKVVEGRKIRSEAEQWLSIRVIDDGVGIDPAVAEKIFEPFYQGKDDLHGQIAGSGIGLSIAKTVVEQLNGLIFVRVPEQGTEMNILLPYVAAAEEEMQESWLVENENVKPANRKHSLMDAELKVPESNYKILIVEDNLEALEYLKKQFVEDYIVLVADNGEKAWDIVVKELPDMVVSDVMMPGIDGLELCSRIKADFRLCHIPVVLLTAKSMSAQIEEGFKAGADDYIAKPFSISLLKIRIKNIFTGREQMKKVFGKKLSLENLGFDVDKANKTFMDRYVAIVKANFRNQDLDVETICSEMQMSRANFYKKLKTITDLSPMELVRNIRLESAARLLKETKMTISEISGQVGFSSNSYFGSCFKALYGMSPKEYQNSKE